MIRCANLILVSILLISSALAAGVTIQDKNLEISNGGLILTSSPIYSDLVPSGSHNLGSLNPAGTSNISGMTAGSISVSTLSVSGSATVPVTSCNYLATDSTGKIICSPSASTTITGSGTTNYIPKFTGAHTLGNSQIYDNGTNVGIGTTSPGYKLDISGNARVTGPLVVGSTAPRNTSSRIIIPGGTSDFSITVQDGTGRVQMYWNSSPGTSPKYLVSNEAAGKILFNPAGSAFFQLFWAPSGTAGSAISWSEKFHLT